MHSEIKVPGGDFGMFEPLREEAGAKTFRIVGCDPFYFRVQNANLEIKFKGAAGERKVGVLGTNGETVSLSTEKGIGKEVHAHIADMAPRIWEAIRECVRIRKERAEALLREGYDLIGPRDNNRKVAVLRIRAQEALTLGGFAGHFRQALPGKLDVLRMSETKAGYFKVSLGMVGEKGVSAPLMSIRFAGSRVETECVEDGEKARGEFAEFIFETIRARHARILADAAVKHAVTATLAEADTTPDWFVDRGRYDTEGRSFGYGGHYSGHKSLLMHTEAFPDYNQQRHTVDIGHGLTVHVNSLCDRGNIVGLSVGGEAISFSNGFLPGITDTQKIWTTAQAKALILRPDLFPREAAAFLSLTAETTETDPDAEMAAAIAARAPAADVPTLEI